MPFGPVNPLALLGRVPQFVWIAIAIGGAAAWIDHRGYQRAEDNHRRELLERVIADGLHVLELDRQLKDGLAALGRGTAASLAAIQERDRNVVQPIIRAELARDPALAGRECLTPELLRAVNASRADPGGAGAADDLAGGAASLPGSAAHDGR